MGEATQGRLGRYATILGGLVLLIAIVIAVRDMIQNGDPANMLVGKGDKEITLKLRDFQYSPQTLVSSVGSSFVIVLDNESLGEHTFTLDPLGVDVTVQPGAQRRVTLPSADSGARYLFYCRFHQSVGMRGWIQLAS